MSHQEFASQGGFVELAAARSDIEAWIRALPIDNNAAAAERVLDLLAELEGATLPVRERLVLLEALGRPVSLLIARLRPHFVGAGMPLSSKGKVAVWLINKICRRLARGYETVFDAGHGHAAGAPHRKAPDWLIGAHRAVFYSLQHLVTCRLANTDPKKTLWRRLHGIYRRASHGQWQQRGVGCSEIGDDRVLSVEQLYKMALLVALVPLWHFRRDQVRELQTSLDVWIDDLDLVPCAVSDTSRILHVVNLRSGLEPISIEEQGWPEAESDCWALDMRRLDAHFVQLFRQLEAVKDHRIWLSDRASISLATLAALKSAWTMGLGTALPELPELPAGPEAVVRESEPEGLWQRVRHLPLAHPRQATRLIHDLLVERNASEMPMGQRFRLLEALAHPLSVVLGSLRKHYTDVPFPVPERARRVMELANELCDMMIDGYQQVVDAVDGGVGLLMQPRRRMRDLAVHRIFFYTLHIVVNCQRLNLRTPDGTWSRLHRHFFAQYEAGRHLKVESCRRLPEYGEHSLEHYYRKILLIGLVPLYYLRPSQIDEVCQVLDTFADLAHIVRWQPYIEQPQGAFLIHMKEDWALRQEGELQGVALNEEFLVLNPEPLHLRLSELTIQAHSFDWEQVRLSSELSLAISTLDILRVAWMERRQQRREPRRPAAGELEVVFSLAGVHYVLGGRVMEETAVDLEEIDGYRTALDLDETIADDLPVEQIDYGSTGAHWDPWLAAYPGHPDRPPVEAAWRPRGDHAHYSFYRARVVDCSRHGCRLMLQAPPGLRIHLGELIGFRKSPDAGMHVAVIRNAELSERGDWYIGVQFLVKEAIAAELRVTSKSAGEAHLPCLLGAFVDGKRTVLVLPYVPRIKSKRLVLKDHALNAPISLSGMALEHSQSFEAYGFELETLHRLDARTETRGEAEGVSERLADVPRRSKGARKSRDLSVWDYI